ncbi:hypothetical protein [Roseinatronobacter sp.]
MSDRLVSDLRKLLADEKQALLRADFDSLETLAARKEVVITELSATRLRDGTLQELRDANAHNQALLGALSRGVSGVRTIISQHIRARNTSCYQKDGSQQPLLPSSGKLARRA